MSAACPIYFSQSLAILNAHSYCRCVWLSSSVNRDTALYSPLWPVPADSCQPASQGSEQCLARLPAHLPGGLIRLPHHAPPSHVQPWSLPLSCFHQSPVPFSPVYRPLLFISSLQWPPRPSRNVVVCGYEILLELQRRICLSCFVLNRAPPCYWAGRGSRLCPTALVGIYCMFVIASAN